MKQCIRSLLKIRSRRFGYFLLIPNFLQDIFRTTKRKDYNRLNKYTNINNTKTKFYKHNLIYAELFKTQKES